MTLAMRYTQRGFDPSIKDELRRSLAPYFGEIPETRVMLMSNAPPTWVAFVSDFLTWKSVLGLCAAAYLKKVAEKIAEQHWDRGGAYAEALRDGTCKALQEIAAAFRKAKVEGGDHFSLGLQLYLPDRHYEIRFGLNVESEEDIARFLACFVQKSESIERFMDAHVPKKDVLGVWLGLREDDSFDVHWQTLDFEMHQGTLT